MSFQSGLKVRLTTSALTTRFVKNFDANQTMETSFFRGTSAPFSSSSVNEKRDQRSSIDAMTRRLPPTPHRDRNTNTHHYPSYQAQAWREQENLHNGKDKFYTRRWETLTREALVDKP